MPTRFKIAITGYNCGRYIRRCLASLEAQTYPHYDACIVDDASTDPVMRSTIEESASRNRWKAIFNPKNRKEMATLIQVTEALECEEEDVIVVLDADDALFNEYALETVAKVYDEGGVWLTYGSSVKSRAATPSCAAPAKPRWIRKRCYRRKPWIFTHLRTYKAFLWNNIRDEDLRGPDGKYWSATRDLATMFPMVEMAGRRFRFIPEFLYLYNDDNPISDHRAFMEEQLECDRLIRAKIPYPILERP